MGIFSCAYIDLRKAGERELATLEENSTSRGIAEPYARKTNKARTGGKSDAICDNGLSSSWKVDVCEHKGPFYECLHECMFRGVFSLCFHECMPVVNVFNRYAFMRACLSSACIRSSDALIIACSMHFAMTKVCRNMMAQPTLSFERSIQRNARRGDGVRGN